MTVIDLCDALATPVNVSLVDNGTDKEIMNWKNEKGYADNLSSDIKAMTVKRWTVEGASSIVIVGE